MPMRRKIHHVRSDQLTCTICCEPVNLETAKTDDDGHGVHEECYVEKVVLESLGYKLACEKIVDAAVSLMRSDYASLQMLYPERGRGGELRLLAFRGFNPQAARFWEWVRADSKSTCGIALRESRRVVAPDIANCDFMADSEDQQVYLQTGIYACQTTPLIAAAGDVVGMISTHWRAPHQPCDRDFQAFDILAKQATRLIEHCKRNGELLIVE